METDFSDFELWRMSTARFPAQATKPPNRKTKWEGLRLYSGGLQKPQTGHASDVWWLLTNSHLRYEHVGVYII